MTAETRFIRLQESVAVRNSLFVTLLGRRSILDFLEAYDDADTSPTRVAESAAAAGLHLDDLDSAVLAIALGHGRESGRPVAATVTAGAVARWVEGSASLADRWLEMAPADRCDIAAELLEDPEVRAFSRRYLGPRDPERLVEGALSDGIALTDDGAIVLAVVMGWDPHP